MALDFPASPALNQVFQNWQWDGTEWVAANASLTYPVTVPQGGTGVVSLPAGQLVTGNGTGPVTGTPFPLTVAQGGTGGTTFAPNNIPKGNASGALLASALYDTGSGLLIGGTPGGGLGAGSFNLPGPLVVNKNAAALPAAPANTVLQAGGIDGSTAWVVVNAFGAAYTQSLLALRNATGTAAAPGALTNGDGVGGSIAFQGYNGSAYVSGSVIAAAANQAWGASATGTYLTFSTTAQGSTGPVNRMYLGNGLMLGSTPTPDLGNGGLVLNANAAALPAPPAGTATGLQIGAVDGAYTAAVIDSFGASGSQAYLRHARGTAAAATAVQQFDSLGNFIWSGRGATTYATGADISANALENWTDTAHGTQVIFDTVSVGASGTTTRMRLAQGLVIGNNSTDPGQGSLILNANAAALPAAISPGPQLQIGAADGNWASIEIGTWGSNANPSVGTRKARGTNAAPTAVQAFDSLGYYAAYGYNGSAFPPNSAAAINFQALNNWTAADNSTQIGFITTAVGTTASTAATRMVVRTGVMVGNPTAADQGVGTLNAQGLYVNGAVVSTSDARLKSNIAPTETDALAALRRIPLFEFDWDNSDRHHTVGFVAQEIPEELEHLVVRGPTEDDTIGVDTLQLLAHTVRAIQQLSERLDGLEARSARI